MVKKRKIMVDCDLQAQTDAEQSSHPPHVQAEVGIDEVNSVIKGTVKNQRSFAAGEQPTKPPQLVKLLPADSGNQWFAGLVTTSSGRDAVGSGQSSQLKQVVVAGSSPFSSSGGGVGFIAEITELNAKEQQLVSSM